MSLNEITLNPQLLYHLYADVLIETQPGHQSDDIPVRFLGQHQKKILIAVTNNNSEFLPEEELSFLTNVLGACKLTIADIAIINMDKILPADTATLTTKLGSTKVLLFGVDPLSFGLPIHFPPFQVQPFNQCTYIYAPPLKDIENEKLAKTKLWSGLKLLFNL